MKPRCKQTAICACILTLAVGFSLGPEASAGSPDDISVERLNRLPSVERQSAFGFVIRELATAISPHPNSAVGSLGLYEFELGFDNRLGFINAGPVLGNGSDPWAAMTEGGDPSKVQWLPAIRLRKGLPFSFEVGADIGWHSGTSQMTVGGYGKLAFLDGWRRAPDAAIQLRYTGYVGNDELELGVFETDLSVGYTFLAPGISSHPDMFFSPFVGYGFLMAHARPLASSVAAVGPVSAWSDEAETSIDPRMFRIHRLFGGIEVGGNRLQFRFSGDVNVMRSGPASTSLQVGMAIRY
ncbi:MAG: hypothetical protein CMP23_01375 [Rickettsiales bacterium]|nr:hypothetical protein [Rickettsiales bacterium]|tara:strand:- start:1012 stop:1899 length:888 start_codon:yes stop_codon:yes gene_type:complete